MRNPDLFRDMEASNETPYQQQDYWSALEHKRPLPRWRRVVDAIGNMTFAQFVVVAAISGAAFALWYGWTTP